MSITQSTATKPAPSSSQEQPLRKIDSGAWAVFFIWVGIVMLAAVPWAWFLVGVGFIILGAQLMRKTWNLTIDPFGVVIGLIFLAAGAWDLLSLHWPLMPIILILLGAYLLWKTLSRA
jgi:hypothetical protein